MHPLVRNREAVIRINDPYNPGVIEDIAALFDGRWWVSTKNGGRINPKFVETWNYMSSPIRDSSDAKTSE